jgi:hypothetical protein
VSQLPLCLKIVYSSYVAVVVPTYWVTYTPWNFLYFCDIALLAAVAGLWLESPLVVSMQALAITVPQLLWVVDLLCRLVTGVHVTGVTAYMFDGSLPLSVRLLSSFHGWLPFLLLWLTWRLGYDDQALVAQSALAVVVLLVSYFLAPAPPPSPERPRASVNINYVYGLNDRAPQARIPSGLWLGCVIVVNVIGFYVPTHLALRRWFPRAR